MVGQIAPANEQMVSQFRAGSGRHCARIHRLFFVICPARAQALVDVWLCVSRGPLCCDARSAGRGSGAFSPNRRAGCFRVAGIVDEEFTEQ